MKSEHRLPAILLEIYIVENIFGAICASALYCLLNPLRRDRETEPASA